MIDTKELRRLWLLVDQFGKAKVFVSREKALIYMEGSRYDDAVYILTVEVKEVEDV